MFELRKIEKTLIEQSRKLMTCKTCGNVDIVLKDGKFHCKHHGGWWPETFIGCLDWANK